MFELIGTIGFVARLTVFLRANIRRTVKHGGVLLMHDYMRSDVLEATLEEIAVNPSLRVISIERAAHDKFRCNAPSLRRALERA